MNRKWMEQALHEAKCARAKDEVPVGAVIVINDQLVASAHNLRETEQSPLGHAEIAALLKAATIEKSWRLPGADLYVTLEPCLMCLAALSQARVANVFFGTRDPKGGALSLGYPMHADARLNHRFNVEAWDQMDLAQSASELLKDFFKQKRHKK